MMQCILSCQIMKQRTTLDLADRLMDMSSVDFSKCEAVYEDGKYSLQGTTQGRYLTGGVPPVRFSM